MDNSVMSVQKVAQLFCPPGENIVQFKQKLTQAEEQGLVPEASRLRAGALWRKGWKKTELSQIGGKLGGIAKPATGMSLAVFTTKGGVLKTTLSLNIARMAALHGLKVCVVGLDIQGDMTNALGFEAELEESSNGLAEVIEKLNRTRGLTDYFHSQVRLEEIIYPTDLDNLFLIPETPELGQLNDALVNVNRREFWLKEKVIDRLKSAFDLVVMDCSPNWNKLTTNALVASDLLVSPLECKINNFRNFKVFQQFLNEFVQEMRMDLKTLFIPTRYSKQRKLSLDILEWYQKNIPGCSPFGIRDCVLGEEAVALNQSFAEHDSGHAAAIEMKAVIYEVFDKLYQSAVETSSFSPEELS